MSEATVANVGRNHRTSLIQPVLGLVVGAIIYVVVAYASAIPLFVGFEFRVLSVIVIAVIAGGCVFVGWRWPVLSMVAGALILAISLLIATSSISTAGPVDGDLFAVLAYGTGSGFAFIVGVVLVSASITAWFPPRTRGNKPA